MNTGRWLRHPVLWLALVLCVLSLAPAAFGTQLPRVTEIAIYALYGAGLNLLIGYTGLVPFGASVFFGCAGYVAALFGGRVLAGEAGALAAAAVFAAALAALIGLLTLRRRGLYFSLLTLAFSQIAFEIALKWTSVTGGENGLQGVERVWFPGAASFHVFCLAVVVVLMACLWQLAHAPFGRALQAIRENEPRALSLGYDVFAIKLVAFMVSGAVIGVAGALLVFLLQGVYADNLGWQHSGDALLTTVLGGTHHFLGPLWGAIVFILLEDKLSAVTENWWLIFGPILVAIALLAPEGLQGLFQRLLRRPGWTLVRPSIPARPTTILKLAAESPRAGTGVVMEIRGLSKRFGAVVTADRIDLDISRTGVHSLIGPNGAGKTTFFNLLAGALRPSAGAIRYAGRDISRLGVHRRARLGLGRSFQIVRAFPQLSAFENVRLAVQARSPFRFGFWRDAHACDPMNQRAWTMLDAVGLDHRAEVLCANLAHGEQRLLEIAIAIATDPALLLLDEPLAGLVEQDRQLVGTLIRKLAGSRAVFLIEHDIDRVLTLSDRLTVLDQGRIIADGLPREVVARPEVIAAYLGHRKDTGVARPLAAVPLSPRPSALLRIEGLCAGYAGSAVLSGLSIEVHEGEVVAILGRNGVGKTTTLRAVVGGAEVSAGRIVFDGADITRMPTHAISRLGIAVVPEGRRLFPNLTVADNLRIAARSGGATLDDVLAMFPRLRQRQRARAETLSGGERQMVAIGRALMAPSRLILLDEPFEGLAPAIVDDLLKAIEQLRRHTSLVIVEHDVSAVLAIADRAYVLVNGQVAYQGDAAALAQDGRAQARLLGVTFDEDVLEPT